MRNPLLYLLLTTLICLDKWCELCTTKRQIFDAKCQNDSFTKKNLICYHGNKNLARLTMISTHKNLIITTEAIKPKEKLSCDVASSTDFKSTSVLTGEIRTRRKEDQTEVTFAVLTLHGKNVSFQGKNVKGFNCVNAITAGVRNFSSPPPPPTGRKLFHFVRSPSRERYFHFILFAWR